MTDEQLARAALDKLARVGGGIPGASERAIRLWRRQLADGEAVGLKGHTRGALRDFLAGDARGSADYWRGVAASAEKMARALADMLATELAAPVTPSGGAAASEAAARAGAAAAKARRAAPPVEQEAGS